MFKAIILTCSDHLRDERTDQGIFHILQGKKSIQTVQDTFLYKLDTYYGILPKVTTETYKGAIKQLVENGHMKTSHVYDDSYTISEKGKKYLKSQSLPVIISHLNGKKHGLYTEKFERRFFLFFQVLSNKRMNNNEYVPIIDDYQIMRDIKILYKKTNKNSRSLALEMYHEMYSILKPIDEKVAAIFIDRLSGFEYYGKSMQQLARKFHITEIDMRIICTAITHYILEEVSKSQDNFPLLSAIYMRNENIHVTASAYETKLLLDQNVSLETIASNRRLKINTIYDHVIEITLHDDSFDIHTFMNDKSVEKVLQTARELDTYQLRDLKKALGDDYSYFHIRLALARGGAFDR